MWTSHIAKTKSAPVTQAWKEWKFAHKSQKIGNRLSLPPSPRRKKRLNRWSWWRKVCEKNGSEKEKLIFFRSFPYHENYVKGTRRRKRRRKKGKIGKSSLLLFFDSLHGLSLSEHIFPTFTLPESVSVPACSKREKPTRAFAQREEKAAEENREERKEKKKRGKVQLFSRSASQNRSVSSEHQRHSSIIRQDSREDENVKKK